MVNTFLRPDVNRFKQGPRFPNAQQITSIEQISKSNPYQRVIKINSKTPQPDLPPQIHQIAANSQIDKLIFNSHNFSFNDKNQTFVSAILSQLKSKDAQEKLLNNSMKPKVGHRRTVSSFGVPEKWIGG